jgi:hypothetical protein
MKIRFEKNTMRWRISQTELQLLAQGLTLVHEVELPVIQLRFHLLVDRQSPPNGRLANFEQVIEANRLDHVLLLCPQGLNDLQADPQRALCEFIDGIDETELILEVDFKR